MTTRPPCCPKGSEALSMTDAYAGGAIGYECPDHGWQWVGKAPLCRCADLGQCDRLADGPDLLCLGCRKHGHAKRET